MGNWRVVFGVWMAIIISLCDAHNQPKDYVDAHNCARNELGLPPMCWDEELVKYADCYAQKRKADCAMIHSYGQYGENLAAGAELSAADAVKMWVEEKADYNYDANSCCEGKMCGHYTQVVWKTSVKVGCARVPCANNPPYYFIICNYCPPGNVIGEKPY